MKNPSISTFEFLLGGSLIETIIVIILIALGITACYFFVDRFLKIRKENRVDPYLIKNIDDLLSDARVQAAVDFCRRDNSPESRCIEKGLHRIGRPITEIHNAMQTQAQIEVNQSEKNVNYLSTIAGLAPILGILGTVYAFASIYSGINSGAVANDQKLISGLFYKALSPAIVGLFVGAISFGFHNYIVAKINYMVMKVQYHTNQFLDIINKPA